MLPEQFWRLTPFEAKALVKGGAWRQESEWERAAFVAAHTINISGKTVKKDVTPAMLLGRKEPFRPRDPVVEMEAKKAELLRRLEDKAKGA